MGLRIWLVDAFSRGPFTGNPAAVVILKQPAAEDWMQSLAMEMNQAETAFVVPRNGRFDLRWFTPAIEVDLCGHATLAASHVLWEASVLRRDEPATFDTLSGELVCRTAGERIEMDFPAEPAQQVPVPAGIEGVLGCSVAWYGANRMDHFAVLESEASVRALDPDMKPIAALGTRGLIVTAPAAPGEFDFVSRFFAPGAGVPEDPATGSAHCCLGPYWSERLAKPVVKGFQASKRGGYFEVEPRAGRVLLRGTAATVLTGELSA